MKQLSSLILAVTFILASCTIQKRIYRPGYTVEWHNAKQSAGEEQLADNNAQKKVQNPVSEQPPSANSTRDNLPTEEDTGTAPLEKQSTLQSQAHQTPSFAQHKTTHNTTARPVSVEKLLKNSAIKAKKSDDTQKKKEAKKGTNKGAIHTAGWTAVLSGIIALFYLSVLLGILLLLLGLLFIIIVSAIAGAANTPTPPIPPTPPTNEKKPSEYIDVVYLKSGNIIRGMIVETIPNVSIKIQTKDGSVFFLKMEEIEKITKELAN